MPRIRPLVVVAVVLGVLAAAVGIVLALAVPLIGMSIDVPGVTRQDVGEGIGAMALVALAGYLIFHGGVSIIRNVRARDRAETERAA